MSKHKFIRGPPSSSIEPVPKRQRKMTSSCQSDSGHSTMSNHSIYQAFTTIDESLKTEWPTLAILTKPEEIVINSTKRTRFPDPVHDR